MQINTESTRSSRQDKYLLFRIWILKIINASFPIFSRSLTVYSTIFVAPVAQKVVKYIEKSCHLAEYEYVEVLLDQLWEQKVKYFELLTGGN
jgi:hypothetical protein